MHRYTRCCRDPRAAIGGNSNLMLEFLPTTESKVSEAGCAGDSRLPALSGNRLLLATLHAVGDGVVSCDCSGQVILMNAAAEQLTGWTQGEALHRELSEVLPLVDEVTRAPVLSPVAELLAGRPQPGRYNNAVRRNGTEYAVDSTVAPVHDEDGSLLGAVLVFRDVSRSRRAEWILELLSETGRVLSEASEKDSVFEKIGALATRQFADLVVFDLLNEDGSAFRLVAPPRTASQQTVAAEAIEFGLEAPRLRATLASIGPAPSLWMPALDEEWLGKLVVQDPQRAAFYRRAGLHSMICVPLLAAGQPLGLLTFGRTLLRAAFDENDRFASEDLGRRLGTALQHTRLTQTLQTERTRLTTIIENTPVGILVADRSGRIVMSNGAVERILRHPVLPTENIEQYGEWVAYHADGGRVPSHEYPLPRAIVTKKVVSPEEYLYQREDGTRSWVSLTAAPILDDTETVTGGVVAILDIEAQRTAQEALRASEERSRQILTSTRDCIKVLDLEGNLLLMNEEGQQRLGITDFSKVQGSSWIEFWMKDATAARQAVSLALAGDTGRFEGEFTTALGESTWWDVTVTPIYDAEGKLFRLLAVSRESTVRKHTELALRESEERFRRLVEQSSVGIVIGSSEGGLSYMNSTLLRLLGYAETDMAKGELHWRDLVEPGSNFWSEDSLLQLEQTGICSPQEKALRGKDGKLVPLLLGASVLGAHAEALEIAVFLTDLTAQKKTERALLESEKLAAVGKLASSISHEINNPLEAVTNLLFLARNAEAVPAEVGDYLGMADKELQRVSQIVAQTLRFHRQSTRPRAVDPASLIDQVLALYAARLNNYGITLTLQYSPDALVTCYEGEVRQVLNNLVGNALDAMRQGGRLTVRTQLVRHWKTGLAGVRVTIADTGTGMSPEVRKRIYEAFFTTKEIHGTGLGLWISSQIVTKHGGSLSVRSTTQGSRGDGLHGTVFTLWLPGQLRVPAAGI